MDATHAYQNLTPNDILNAIDATGLRCSGHVFALNSYENRVYEIGIEDDRPVIAKFYRPGRWSDSAILEEHRFVLELAEYEIPVIAPLRRDQGTTLFHTGSHRFALYPRTGGRPPEPDDPEQLLQLGRCIARVHNVGSVEPFQHRPVIDIETFAVNPRRYLLENGFIPADIRDAYTSTSEAIINRLAVIFENTEGIQHLRLHGDCHIGNILLNEGTPFLVDFDDARMGPAIQDLWMMLSGDRAYMTARLHDLMEGYSQFREFDPRELNLIEPLRTLRMIHYAGWLAQRWDDPAFPLAFPWFNTQHYWQDHVLNLREQAAMLDEPPLEWHGI